IDLVVRHHAEEALWLDGYDDEDGCRSLGAPQEIPRCYPQHVISHRGRVDQPHVPQVPSLALQATADDRLRIAPFFDEDRHGLACGLRPSRHRVACREGHWERPTL